MFEHILVIHLSRNHSLWKSQFTKLQEYLSSHSETKDIKLQPIEAVDGKYFLDKEPLFMNELLRTKLLSLEGCGFRKTLQGVINELCCYLSHIKVWNYILEHSLQNVLILEEGILFEPKRWDQFLTQCSQSSTFFSDLTNSDICFWNQHFQSIQTPNSSQSQLEGFSLQAYSVKTESIPSLQTLCQELTCPIDLYIRNLCNQSKLSWKTYSSVAPDCYLATNNFHRSSSISGGQEKKNYELNSHQEPLSLRERIMNKLFQKQTPFQYLL